MVEGNSGTTANPVEIKQPDPADLAGTGELRGRDDSQRESLPGKEAVRAAAAGAKLTPEDQDAALEWFLSTDPEEDDEVTTIEINVGTADKPRFIPWTIRSIDLDVLRRIRRQAMSGNRAARRAGGQEVDEIAANLRIILEGTVKPDIAAAARELGIADPATALRLRFKRKPGLLGQIAAEIMSLSGYDEEDVREAQAAGN